MQRCLWSLVIGVALMMSILTRGTDAMELQGHRGARGVLPENTLPGFQHAIAEGMDCLELDIAMTRDKKIVVTHDPGLRIIERARDAREELNRLFDLDEDSEVEDDEPAAGQDK